MFLQKYLNNLYYELVQEQYSQEYLENLDEENFIQIYKLFQNYNFYFINDIIVRYLEIFTLDADQVNRALIDLKEELGDKFTYIIGDDMRYLSLIIDSCSN